jgi:large subunit ribosomal protein L21
MTWNALGFSGADGGISPLAHAVYRCPRPLTVQTGVCYKPWFHFSEVVVYAIIRSGGKQYRVTQGDVLRLERDVLANAKDEKVTFGDVLMVGGDKPQIGSPLVSGASVLATIIREDRGEKIIVFKKKRRKNHTKRMHGHRQELVELRIDSINA